MGVRQRARKGMKTGEMGFREGREGREGRAAAKMKREGHGVCYH